MLTPSKTLLTNIKSSKYKLGVCMDHLFLVRNGFV